MANFIYVLESYNSKKRQWEHRTTTSSLVTAKQRCIEMSKYEGKKMENY